MKHNILLLMIFIPILVYQLYYTFRYLKEGLNYDLPEFCKGKDGHVHGELWGKKTDDSKCKWKGIPPEDKNHCIYKQRKWCEMDCKGKFDLDGEAWCTEVGKGGEDAPNVPSSDKPFCDRNFIENIQKKCSDIYDPNICDCWEEFKESICKLPPSIADFFGAPHMKGVFKMHCTKGYTKEEWFREVMADGGNPTAAEKSWKLLSHDGRINNETVSAFIEKEIKREKNRKRDAKERKKAGIGPPSRKEGSLLDDSSEKTDAIITKKRKAALASGKSLVEAENDAKNAVAKISDGGGTKEKIKEVVKDIAGGGGTIAAQAIASKITKMDSDKKAAEATMAAIPKKKDAPAIGAPTSGSLDSVKTPNFKKNGAQTESCAFCRVRGGANSVYCKRCRKLCKQEEKIWNGKDCVKPKDFYIGGCRGTQFGCCPGGKTAKKDLAGSNCSSSCETSKYGCCPDDWTTKSDSQGSNCSRVPPHHHHPNPQMIEGRFKAWVDNKQEIGGRIPQILSNENKFQKPKKSDLKGTTLKTVRSEVNKRGWCIPRKNKKGKILSWIAKPRNKSGWSKTDKCLTIEGKEIIFGTGRCLRGKTRDECNLGLVKLEKDKYWKTHPVLLQKKKQFGVQPTISGKKYNQFKNNKQ